MNKAEIMKITIQYLKGDEELIKCAVDWIDKIFDDVKFNADPHAYVENWNNQRGNEEEMRMPEDILLRIFSKYYIK